jgi:hypothetical protein
MKGRIFFQLILVNIILYYLYIYIPILWKSEVFKAVVFILGIIYIVLSIVVFFSLIQNILDDGWKNTINTMYLDYSSYDYIMHWLFCPLPILYELIAEFFDKHFTIKS